MDAQTLLDEAVAQGALDSAAADLLTTLDRRHKAMVRRARAFMKSAVVAGGTVASQQLYSLPAGLVEAEMIDVDGTPYQQARHKDIAMNAQGLLYVSWPGTAFARTHDAAGVEKIALIPAPSDAGKVITVYGAYEPPTLALVDTLLVDDEALAGLKAGVWADVMMWPGEGRPDLAPGYETIFGAACDEYRQRVRDRLRGSGATQIRMAS